MKIEIQVTPILIKSEITPAEVARIFSDFRANAVRIQRVGGGVLVFCQDGTIGNQADHLFIALSRVETPEKYGDDSPYFKTVRAAKKIVQFVEDDTASSLISEAYEEFG